MCFRRKKGLVHHLIANCNNRIQQSQDAHRKRIQASSALGGWSIQLIEVTIYNKQALYFTFFLFPETTAVRQSHSILRQQVPSRRDSHSP